MTTDTAATQITTYLNENKTSSYTNRDLADALQLPIDSVRRCINSLRAQGRVVRDEVYGRNSAVVTA